MFRLYTEEVKNRKRKADKSGREVEATLNINEVNSVTFWSMSDPCRNLEEEECARRKRQRKRGGKSSVQWEPKIHSRALTQ